MSSNYLVELLIITHYLMTNSCSKWCLCFIKCKTNNSNNSSFLKNLVLVIVVVVMDNSNLMICSACLCKNLLLLYSSRIKMLWILNRLFCRNLKNKNNNNNNSNNKTRKNLIVLVRKNLKNNSKKLRKNLLI